MPQIVPGWLTDAMVLRIDRHLLCEPGVPLLHDVKKEWPSSFLVGYFSDRKCNES